MRQGPAIVLFLGVVACGAAPAPVRTPPPVAARALVPEAEPIADALRHLCDIVGRAVGDRSVPFSVRAGRAAEELTPYRAILEPLDSGEPGPPYPRALRAAREHGVEFSCPAFEQFLALLESGEDDVDPRYGSSMATDAPRLCAIVAEETARASGMTAAVAIMDRIPVEIRHMPLREAFIAAAAAPGETGLQVFYGRVAEGGLPQFRCQAIDTMLRE